MSGCCDPCVVTSPDLSSTADHALDPPASSPLIFGKCKFLTLWKYISRLNLFVVNEKTNNFGSQRMAKVGSESPELNFIRLNCLPLTLYIILHTFCGGGIFHPDTKLSFAIMPQFWGKMKLSNQAHSNLENQMQFSQNERWKRSVYSKVIIRSCCTSKCSNRWHDWIRKLIVFFYRTKLFWVKNQANEDHMLILNNQQWSCWGSVGNICLLHCWFRKCQQNNTCQTLKKGKNPSKGIQ